MDDAQFLSLWRQVQGTLEPDQRPLCLVASEWLQKVEEMVFAPLSQTGVTPGKMAQAKYMLTEEYHRWRKSLPTGHQGSAQDHHRCLLEVYEAAYDRLTLMELTARPPSLIVIYDEVTKPAPPPPPPSPPPQIAGIFLGELDEK